MNTPEQGPSGFVTQAQIDAASQQWAFADHPESEHWHGPYSSKVEAIKEALVHYGDPEDGYKPCVATCRPVLPGDDVEEDWKFIVEGKPEIIDFS